MLKNPKQNCHYSNILCNLASLIKTTNNHINITDMTRQRQSLLHGALLAALLLLVSVPALADLTIRVQKGGQAPYLYAYTGSGDGATKHTGDWPGTQFTEKDGAYWTMTISGVNQVNIILNMGENGPQTADYLNLSGIDGVISLMYDGNTTMFGTMPTYPFSANKVYFAAPPTWGSNIYVHAWSDSNNDNGWPGQQMTKIGTDGMGLDIYEMDLSNWNTAPLYVQFNNNGGDDTKTGTLNYEAGGYYNTSKTVAQFMGLTESAFPDENFRNAIKASTGMSSDVFTPSSITYLDVSNQGISSIKGIELFTNLQTLLAARNNISRADFGSNGNLEVLDLSSNSSSLIGPSASSGAGHITFKNGTALTYLDLSNNSGLTYFSAIYNTYHINTLETLKLANVPLGWAEAVSHQTNLTHLDLSNSNLESNKKADLSQLTKLEYLDLSNNANLKQANLSLPSSLPTLKTLKLNGCNALETLSLTGCTSLQAIDVTGNTAMKTLTMNNDNLSNDNMPTITGLSSCTSLTTLDLSSNAFPSVPSLDLPASCTSLYMNSNQLTSIAIPSGSPVEFLYAEANNFPAAMELTAENAGSLKGLDLGNNGFTSFKAEGTALSALMVGNNPQMTTLELHGNDNLTVTTAGTTMSDGSGLYLLGNTALKTIDLSNSSFTQIGANAALQGLTAVETLNGSHNKFTTFTNSNYNNGERLASYVAGKASLEHLTGLKHLDLSYNELADSVHLFRNTLLEYLDVSHNNVIGPLATTEAEKLAMRLKKADLLRKYHNKSTAIGISCPAATQATLDANEAVTHRAFDLRDIDLRDTTGLFHLDLNYNTQLKYLDISDTNIHNTAAGWWYMNPGWEFGTGGWYSTTTPSMSKSPANGSTRHHFVWLKTCGKLEEFHADNDNMQSLGLSTSPYLHTITAKGMYGDCYFMRDAGSSSNPNNLTERGNISISGSVATYSRTVYTTNSDGTLSGTVYYKDADGMEGGTNYYPNPVKWYDVSNSGYYAIRTTYGVNLEHLDVSGNHLSELKVSGNTKLQYVDTENNDRLTYVDANDLPDLNTLKVADNPLLEKIYADNDPSLPGISGLEACTALKYLHVQNDGLLGSNNFNVLSNTNLQSLLASSCNLPGELKVSQCSDLDTLSVHNNQLTRLDVSTLQNMHWLNCYNNVGIQELSVAASTGMTHLDLHNCRVIDLALASNTALKYFDCDDNKVRELTLAGAADIDTIHANRNNLFQLNLAGPHTKLKDLQFEHNHINGIDLTGCVGGALTADHIKDADNGRTITANVAQFYSSNVNPELLYLYYFQLDAVSANNGGGKYLNYETCNEDEEEDATTRTYGRNKTDGTHGKTLEDDGVNLSKIQWTQKVDGTRSHRSRADYGELDPGTIIGDIAVLDNAAGVYSPDGSGTETYQYDNDISLSEFYLNWTANGGIITEVTDMTADPLNVTGGQGCITITSPQAITITVYDLAGRTVAQRDIDAGQTVIDGLQPGIYIVAGQKVVVN